MCSCCKQSLLRQLDVPLGAGGWSSVPRMRSQPLGYTVEQGCGESWHNLESHIGIGDGLRYNVADNVWWLEEIHHPDSHFRERTIYLSIYVVLAFPARYTNEHDTYTSRLMISSNQPRR